jgi:glycosyltransferase involved in cell wall biosynthesis
MAQKALKKKVYIALIGKRHLEGAAAVHTTAQFELEQARKHFPAGHGVVVPNLLDLTQFDTLPGPDAARTKFPAFAAGQPVVLFLSRIHVKKGIEHLLRAAAVLRDQGAPAQFVIAGTGNPDYMARMKALSDELALTDRVHFVGEVLGTDKLSLYQAADLFVLPTSQENFGFVFAEALACRTPVVTTKGVDIWPELQASGGAVIASTDPAELSKVISTLLADPARLRAMGDAGRRWVYQDLHPERVLDLFESMYKQGVSRSAIPR